MFQETVSTLISESNDILALETFELRQLYKEDVARALALICQDSSLFPRRYLEDTIVPYGGE